MLSAEQFFEVKRKEVEQGSEKHGMQAVDVTMDRSNDQSKDLVPERREVTVTVSTISSETCYEAGDNMMNYSIGNKTTTLINLYDVPYNLLKTFFSPMKAVKISKARQASVDDRASKVSISRKKYGHQQASKCCSSSAISLPQGAASWFVLATPPNIASDESII
ncbi:hypothetical protein RDI58_010574 [Solanum bulbocastanum]|uniref:Uncharacterized protein n=1 Tax=Solanum bulbocastanum TaxID=147425 RepID=A0AAN8TN66_SOLBU